MSNDGVTLQPQSSGFPELSPLGKQLEVLRIGRGLSKQYLARVAGTSRQQLWRVMTGKAELTGSLRQRLADVLQVDVAALGDGQGVIWSDSSTISRTATLPSPSVIIRSTTTLGDYLADVTQLERTLASLPSGDSGRELKRALLNALEDQAVAQHITLGAAFFDLRRRVLAREL